MTSIKLNLSFAKNVGINLTKETPYTRHHIIGLKNAYQNTMNGNDNWSNTH